MELGYGPDMMDMDGDITMWEDAGYENNHHLWK
jgi:hypothetical protein